VTSIHQHSAQSPYHISAGAVLINEHHEIAAHHFESFTIPGLGTITDFYILMRESLENNETLEQAIQRGLSEEMGAAGTIMAYLGSETHESPTPGHGTFQKTTHYYLVKCTDFDERKRDSKDPESTSTIAWLQAEELINAIDNQHARYGYSDLDEREIIVRAQKYLFGHATA
jgi:hypothetical protein